MKKGLSSWASMSILCLLLNLFSSCNNAPSISVIDYDISNVTATTAYISGHFKFSNVSNAPICHNYLYIEVSENKDFSNLISRTSTSRQDSEFRETLRLLRPDTKHYWRLFLKICWEDEREDEYAYSEVDSIITKKLEVKEYAVDLGFPSGTLWGKMNVGAYSPSSRGHFVQYGVVGPYVEDVLKGYGDYTHYKWAEIDSNGHRKFTKYYDDNKSELDLEDDAAYMNWGPGWRTPSEKQWKELCKYCTYEFTKLDDVRGIKFKSLKNGNSIFLPVTDSREDIWRIGDDSGCYWSRTNYLSASYHKDICNPSGFVFYFQVPHRAEYATLMMEGKMNFQDKSMANGHIVRPVYNP